MRYCLSVIALLISVLGASISASAAIYTGLPSDRAMRRWVMDSHRVAGEVLDQAIFWWESSQESRSVLTKLKRIRAALNSPMTVFHFPEGKTNWDQCDKTTWAMTFPKKDQGRIVSANDVYFCKVTWDFSVKALAEIFIHESVHVALIDVQGDPKAAECSAAELTAQAMWAAGYLPLWSKYVESCGLAGRFNWEHSPLR